MTPLEIALLSALLVLLLGLVFLALAERVQGRRVMRVRVEELVS